MTATPGLSGRARREAERLDEARRLRRDAQDLLDIADLLNTNDDFPVKLRRAAENLIRLAEGIEAQL